jgi:hypothetical protein
MGLVPVKMDNIELPEVRDLMRKERPSAKIIPAHELSVSSKK